MHEEPKQFPPQYYLLDEEALEAEAISIAAALDGLSMFAAFQVLERAKIILTGSHAVSCKAILDHHHLAEQYFPNLKKVLRS